MSQLQQSLSHLPHELSTSPKLRETFLNNAVMTLAPEELEELEEVKEPSQKLSAELRDDDRFELERYLARGAYGEVWRAKDSKLKRPVAIKSFMGHPNEAQLNFTQELKFVARLAHPGVPAIYDSSEGSDPNPFIVMQLIEGVTLRDVIDRLQSGDPEAHNTYHFYHRMDLILQLLRVLSQIHEQGVIHRDIKPENLMLGKTGELYLMDWGIAIDTSDYTTGKMSGTPLYMSPEQFRAEAATIRSDIYSVGAVAYELLTLHPTIWGDTILEVGMKVLSHDIPHAGLRAHPTQGTIPSEFANLIMKAISFEPEGRYESASQMQFALTRAMGGYFEAVCDRTSLKGYIFRLLRWIDRDPLKRLRLMKLTLGGLTLMIFISGVALGVYL